MLIPRILSALVMLPVAVAAIWFGGYVFAALVALIAAVTAWEWDRLVGGSFGTSGIILGAAGVGAAALALQQPPGGLLMIVVATGAVFLITWLRGDPRTLWHTAGGPYMGLPVIALVWLRADPVSGFETILWLLVVVWATDIGGYAFGRLIGGPKLAPRLSPKKTWAGLLGGMLCAGLAGVATALWLHLSPLALGSFSAVLAVVAQAGDIFESAVKRRFNVKDSSNIIPGHGGVLDRVDGVLPVAVLVAIIAMIQGGGILTWR